MRDRHLLYNSSGETEKPAKVNVDLSKNKKTTASEKSLVI